MPILKWILHSSESQFLTHCTMGRVRHPCVHLAAPTQKKLMGHGPKNDSWSSHISFTSWKKTCFYSSYSPSWLGTSWHHIRKKVWQRNFWDFLVDLVHRLSVYYSYSITHLALRAESTKTSSLVFAIQVIWWVIKLHWNLLQIGILYVYQKAVREIFWWTSWWKRLYYKLQVKCQLYLFILGFN